MRIKTVLLATVMVIATSSLFALSTLNEVVGDLSGDELSLLREGRTLEACTADDEDIVRLAPAGSLSRRRAEEAQAYQGVGFSLAGLSLLEYPDAWKDLSVEQRQLEIFNMMRRISTQNGITYISHRAGDKPMPLFKESFYISDPESRTPIADPVVTEVPEHVDSYVYQYDTSFEGNPYLHHYENSADEISLEVINLSKLKYRGITLMEPENFKLSLSCKQTDEGLLVYSMARVDDTKPKYKILWKTVYVTSSISKRMTAVKNWFVGLMEEV